MLQMAGSVLIEVSMRSSIALVHVLWLKEAVHIMAPSCQYFGCAHSADVSFERRMFP
jgi:hypothetical protein